MNPKREFSIFFNKMCKQIVEVDFWFLCWFSSISKNLSFLNYYDVLEVSVCFNIINIWVYFRELNKKPGRRTKTWAQKLWFKALIKNIEAAVVITEI